MVDGTLLCGHRRYVVEEYGRETWEAVLADAPIEPQVFVPGGRRTVPEWPRSRRATKVFTRTRRTPD